MTAIEFVKPAFDVGMATNRLEAHRDFWGGEIGLAYDHLAKLGGGLHQHRWRQGASIVKVNHSREPLEPAAPGGYVGLTLAAGREAALTSPDGLAVTLAPAAPASLRLHVRTADLDAFRAFYGERLGLAPEPGAPAAFRLGESVIEAAEGPAPARGDRFAIGLRYMTVQIADCDAVTALTERRGAEVAQPPRTLGSVRYSFLRDPDGNWIELSERASLTGRDPRPD